MKLSKHMATSVGANWFIIPARRRQVYVDRQGVSFTTLAINFKRLRIFARSGGSPSAVPSFSTCGFTQAAIWYRE